MKDTDLSTIRFRQGVIVGVLMTCAYLAGIYMINHPRDRGSCENKAQIQYSQPTLEENNLRKSLERVVFNI